MENHLFTFYATPNSKFPQQIQARFCFYDEFVEIPHTEAKMEVEHGCWIIYSEDSNISLLTMEDFVENFEPENKKTSRYLDFVFDSHNTDYAPNYDSLDDALLDSINELVEKEINLTFALKIRLIWDIIKNKKINFDAYK
jgi:hypothetical protein